jgi:CheY-like chemotaxis protein
MWQSGMVRRRIRQRGLKMPDFDGGCRKHFAFSGGLPTLRGVNEPLALLLCDRGVIATQLAQRLEGLRYRMAQVGKPADLVARAETEKAMVVLADVDGQPEPVILVLQQLRQHPATAHIPIIGFVRQMDDTMEAALAARGVTMTVTEAAVLTHLPQLLDRALDVH